MAQVVLHRSVEHKPGTRGVRVRVRSNMFRLVRDYEMDFYQYDGMSMMTTVATFYS